MTTSNAPARRLIDELNELHDHYAQAINVAIESGDHRAADDLAAAYDNDAVQLVAEREGKTHLLPLLRSNPTDTPLRRLAGRLKRAVAA